MKFQQIKKVLTMGLLGVILLFGTFSTSASAQHHGGRVVIVNRPFVRPFGWYGGFYRPYYYPVDPIAYQREQGYSDGLSRGKDDAKHGKANDPASHKHYTNANSITYREAFAQGYADGYRARMNERMG
jgi:hypothetical protein